MSADLQAQLFGGVRRVDQLPHRDPRVHHCVGAPAAARRARTTPDTQINTFILKLLNLYSSEYFVLYRVRQSTSHR